MTNHNQLQRENAKLKETIRKLKKQENYKKQLRIKTEYCSKLEKSNESMRKALEKAIKDRAEFSLKLSGAERKQKDLGDWLTSFHGENWLQDFSSFLKNRAQ